MSNLVQFFSLIFVVLILFSISDVNASPKGLRAVLIYTFDDSIIGADIKTQEVNAEVFKKFSSMKEIISKSTSLASSFELLNFLYDRCDVQLKCNVKPNELNCEKCEILKDCEEKTITKKTTTANTKRTTTTPTKTLSTTDSTMKVTESITTKKLTTESKKLYLPPDNTTTAATKTTQPTITTTKPSRITNFSVEATINSLSTTSSTTTSSTSEKSTSKQFTTISRTTKKPYEGPEYLPVSKPSVRPAYTPWTGTYRPYTGTFQHFFTFKPATLYEGTWRTRKYTPGTFTPTPHYQYTAPANNSENNDKTFD